eukprot:7275270-Heterocapsa_arctica.AAC.1
MGSGPHWRCGGGVRCGLRARGVLISSARSCAAVEAAARLSQPPPLEVAVSDSRHCSGWELSFL